MYTFFIVCAGLGAAVLILQIALSVIGGDVDGAEDVDLGEGLDLLSVRALAAGAAGFGLGGLALMEMGLPGVLALPGALLPALLAVLATAWLTRSMLRLESSGSIRLEEAVGRAGTVHLSIPAASGGAGRVQFELQGRTLEMRAVSPDAAIPSGAPVTIVGIVDGDTVEVMPTPTMKEILG
jgi:hypothetical protein